VDTCFTLRNLEGVLKSFPVYLATINKGISRRPSFELHRTVCIATVALGRAAAAAKCGIYTAAGLTAIEVVPLKRYRPHTSYPPTIRIINCPEKVCIWPKFRRE